MSDLSIATYTASGAANAQYAVPFPFLNRQHVRVLTAYKKSDGSFTAELMPGSGFLWIDNSLIQVPAMAADTVFSIVRQTPSNEALVDWVAGGGALTAAELRMSTLQQLYLSQERLDQAASAGGIAQAAADNSAAALAQVSATLAAANAALEAANQIIAGTLADGSVTTPKIADNAVTQAKIGSNVLTPRVSSINDGPLAGFRNLLINANTGISQRGYVNGTPTSEANQYTIDRWRVVVAGEALSWTGNLGVFNYTAPAGGVEQIIEGAFTLGGVHTLSWLGTASATVNGTPVDNGGQVTLTGGANTTVRFSGGTFRLAQLEPGPVATPFERRPQGIERLLCSRYYHAPTDINRTLIKSSLTGLFGRALIGPAHFFPVPMRVAPTITYTDVAGNANRWSIGTLNNQAPAAGSLRITTLYVAADVDFGALGQDGLTAEARNFTASAEL